MGDLASETEDAGLDPGLLALRAEIAKDLEDGESGGSVNETGEEVEDPEAVATAEVVAPVRQPAEKVVVADTDAPWEGVNPQLKAAFVNMTEQVKTLGASQDRVKQLEFRVGAITNELTAAKAAAVTTEKAPTDEEMAAAAESDEAWEKLKGDFPEWTTAFDGRFKAIKDGSGKEVTELKAEIESIKTDLAGKASEAKIEERVVDAVMSYAHSGWRDTIASADYAAWLAIQTPEFITKAETSTDFTVAISVLDAFSASKEKPERTASEIAASRSARLKGSALPEGGKIDAPKSDADMTEQELRSQVAKEVWAET